MTARVTDSKEPRADRGRPCPSLMRLSIGTVVANVEICLAAGSATWARLPPSLVLKIYEELTGRDL